MPGILPMKVIKVGNSAQSRIAQACDRCRSKKIRCDGVRPTCSQCTTVGFECRTSDKLSRRAFPRGYTESLEERVRVLEAEAREMKDLLDEKDAKIDHLTAGRSKDTDVAAVVATASSVVLAQACASTAAVAHATADSSQAIAVAVSQENTFRTQTTQLLLGVESSDSYFMGPSSGRAFIASLKQKMQESGKPCIDFNPDAFLHIQGCPPLSKAGADAAFYVPPRLFTDRCVNVFFSEWAPLFPVLHRPGFLSEYEHFVTDAEKIKNDYKVARLYLVFSIAGLSLEPPDLEQVARCERQWIRALDRLIMENTMDTLRCLVLAVLYCALRADYRRLQHFKSVAVGLSYRLGLHQSQKRLFFDPLTLETRRKVFWTLYTLDCFTAAILGLPKILKEELVHAEYPSDADDESLTGDKDTRHGSPAGEQSQMSSALALFGASRVLSHVLEKNYPVSTSYDLSLEQMASLDAELDGWYKGLPQHLRIDLAQGKPVRGAATCDRSPLLALAYYYIRTLIYRPAVGSSLGPRAGPALVAISESSERIIQITQLLEERSLALSFCINKGDMLAMCGLTLLYRMVDLWRRDNRLTHESARLVIDVLGMLRRDQSPGFEDMQRVANVLLSLEPGTAAMADADEATDRHATAGPGRRASGTRAMPGAVKAPHKSPSSDAAAQWSPPPLQAPTVPSQHHDSSRRFVSDHASPGRAGAAGEPAVLRSQGPLSRIVKASAEYRPDAADARGCMMGHSPAMIAGQKRKDSRQRLPTGRSPCKVRRSSGQSSATQARPNLDYLEFHHHHHAAQHGRPGPYSPCPHPHTSSPSPGSHALPHPASCSRAPGQTPPLPGGPLSHPGGPLERAGGAAPGTRPHPGMHVSSSTSSPPPPPPPPTTTTIIPRAGLPPPVKSEGVSETEWEAILGAMEGGSNNVHNAIYGGTSMLGSAGAKTAGGAAGAGAGAAGVGPGIGTGGGTAGEGGGWPSSVWGLHYTGRGAMAGNPPGATQSVLSMSEESLSSGEEVSPPEMGVHMNGMDYQEQMQGFNLDDLFLL